MKANSRTAAVKRPMALEADYMREEMRRTLKGLVAPAAIFAVQLFVPQRKHVFLANLVDLLVILSAQLFTVWALKKASGHTQTKNMHMWNSAVHHTVRTLGHVAYIAVDEKDMFGRLFFLFVAPCSAARMSSYSSFIGYMVAHLSLVLCRFAGSVSEELPFLIAALACTHILHDVSLLKKRCEETALEKSNAVVTLTADIAQEVLECFCDATARISPSMKLVEDSPSLSTLLSRKAHSGKCFTDFVHAGDCEDYINFVQVHADNAKRVEEIEDVDAMHEIDHVKGLQLQFIDLHLEDSMNIPVEVHVFHAQVKNLVEQPVYLIGISERESYKHTRKKASNSRRTKRVDQTQLDFETGKLGPTRPAFNETDIGVMSTLEALRGDRADVDTVTSSGRMSGQAPGRSDSPRPRSKEGLSIKTGLWQRNSLLPSAD